MDLAYTSIPSRLYYDIAHSIRAFQYDTFSGHSRAISEFHFTCNSLMKKFTNPTSPEIY